MPSTNTSAPDNQLQAQVNLLSGILRLGHETFDKDGVVGIGLHIVNNSRLIFKYDRCSLVSIDKGRIRLLAVSGQTIVQKDSEYGREIKDLIRGFRDLEKPAVLTTKTIDTHTTSHSARSSFTNLAGDGTIVLLPLNERITDEQESNFIWIVEFFDDFDPAIENSLSLLGKHYGQALSLEKRSHNRWSKLWWNKAHRAKKTIVCVCLLTLFLSLFTVRVNQTVIADCELTPITRQIGYAPFKGIIRESFYKDGDRIKNKSVVLAYDIEEMLFELAEARKREEVIAAELDLVRQRSFASMEQLGRVKLLELKLKSSQIDIDRNNWYIEHSRIGAAIDGVLIIDDPEHFSGKAVTPGEKLFELVNPSELAVTIFLHESDSGILNNLQPHVSIFLDARPEKEIEANVDSVSPKPILTDTGQFAYTVKAPLQENATLVNGMRGVARLKGGKVLLIHYFFRNLLLWWRKV